jgi:superfamily II DNA or RNA helicase
MTIAMQLGSHIRVKRDLVDEDRIRSDLWIADKSYEKRAQLGYKMNGASPGVSLLEEDGDWLIVPRGYKVPFRRTTYEWEDIRPEAESIRAWGHDIVTCTDGDWNFKRALWPKQEPAAQALIKKPGDKLLCMGCGKGKSSIALWYAAQRKKRTLIIVDRDFLVDQWTKEVEDCLGLDVGLVQGTSRTIGPQITIGMIQTLSQQEFPRVFYDQFGLVIVDECHMLGAHTFAGVLPNFPGERLLLSATPFRADGLSEVFLHHAGGTTPVYTDISRERSSSWFFLMMPKILEPSEEAKAFRKIPATGKWAVNRPVYDTLASKSLKFNQLILDEVLKAAAKGRNVLILGSRVDQLTMLSELTAAKGYDVGLVTGDVKGDERREQFKRQLLFVTDKIGSRALDVPRLDVLILLTQNTDPDFLRQTVGRIDRELEGKGSPLVLVFCHPLLEKKNKHMERAILEVDSKARIREIQRR